MSYDISLVDHKTKVPVSVVPHEEGGTYVVGGTPRADLNITYNYSKFYCEHVSQEHGIRWLYGKTGREVVDTLETAVAALGTERDNDYWKASPGNAGYALSILLQWAKSYPEAVFEGD